MLRFILSCLIGFAFSISAVAGEQEMKQVKSKLVQSFPELSAAAIKQSPASGLYEVELDTQVFYVSPDGKYLFMGDILELGSHANLTEARRAAIRTRLLDEVGEENMIVMGPKKPQRTLTVFTDVDCPYCAKFHLDVPALNKAGVKVRYLFFPRAGVNSETYKRSVAVWCADDRVKAIGIAKSGGKLNMKTCANPVEKDYLLGQRLGVEGTPTIFVDDGKKIPGYVPAQRMLGLLGIRDGSQSKASQ